MASVVFFPGCNFRCPWCHNRELVLGTADDLVPLGECLEEIGRRRRLIRGLVISGGEPLLCGDIGSVIGRAHEFGLSVKLDTNGSLPGRLSALCRDPAARPDYVAVDLKTSPRLYGGLAAPAEAIPGTAPASGDPFPNIRHSIEALAAMGVSFELRSVVAPGYIDEETVTELAAFVPGGVPWYFTPFAPGNCLDPAWNEAATPPAGQVSALVRLARELGKNAMER